MRTVRPGQGWSGYGLRTVQGALAQAIALPDKSPLGPAVQAAMSEIVKNGTYAKILDKWGVAKVGYTSADDVKLFTDATQVPAG